MNRHVTTTVVLTLLLAGCLGGPGTPGAGPSSPTESGPTVTPGEPPGVTDGSLANASELAAANAERLTSTGFVSTINRSFGAGESFDQRIVASPGTDTYTLTGTRTVGDSSSGIQIWGNESIGVVRIGDGSVSDYRTRPNGYDVLGDLVRLEPYLEAGEYTVENETADGATVLVADEYEPADGHGPFRSVSSFESRIVADGSGLIHALDLTATTPDGEVSISYTLEEIGTTTVDRPSWVADVPGDAFLHPRLTTNVHNGSYLEVENTGEDPLPARSTISVKTNGTTYEATTESAVETGDRIYVYITEDGETLALSAEPPFDVTPLSSPVSITIATESGTTVHSGGIGWGSASADESGEGSAGNSSGGAGESAS